MPFQYKYTEQGQAAAKQLSGRKQREIIALEKNISPEDVQLGSSKKHFKGNKKKGKAKSKDLAGFD
jgi:large subunit GTPase 1